MTVEMPTMPDDQPLRRFRFRFSLKQLFVAVALVAVGLGIWNRFIAWLATPRVSVVGLENSIRTSLPVGSSRKTVEAWLTNRSMPTQNETDDSGQTLIQSWIANSGPRAEWPFGVRDIRIQFIFDENERLVSFTAKEEDRF
jgi:hypothetical protein